MPITLEEKLKQILEIEAKIEAIVAYKDKQEAIEKKRESIAKLREELVTQNALVATVDPDLLDMMSQSASRSKKKRAKGETRDISDSVAKAKERIAEINAEVLDAEEELELWQAELDKLQGDLDNVSLDELEQLEEDKQRLEQL